MQAVVGPAAAWSDTEYLLAHLVDIAASHEWLTAITAAGRRLKKPPKTTPKPLPRPGDLPSAENETVSANLDERTSITAGSLSLAALDAAVAEQTGTAQGIAAE